MQSRACDGHSVNTSLYLNKNFITTMAGSESCTLEIAFLLPSRGLSTECHSRREQRPWHWTLFSTNQPGHLCWHYPLIYQTWEAMNMCFLSKSLFICSLGVGWPFWGMLAWKRILHTCKISLICFLNLKPLQRGEISHTASQWDTYKMIFMLERFICQI